MSSPLGYQLSPYVTQMESTLGSVQSNGDLPAATEVAPPQTYVSPDLVQAAADAVSAWKSSAANQQLLTDMQAMPFSDLRPTLKGILADPAFADV